MFEMDEFSIFSGDDICITDKIIVKQPTIREIKKFGERKYFQSVYSLTGVGADFKWQLWDYYGIDYTTIEDFELFKKMIVKGLSSRKNIYKELMDNQDKYEEELKKITKEELDEMLVNPLSLILNIDFADFEEYDSDKNPETILYDKEHDITIDRFVYMRIVDTVRKIHYLKRNNQVPANDITKMFLIDEARENYKNASEQEYKSVLKPLVSALMVKTGQLGKNSPIFDCNVNMFFDALKRANKIQDATLLLQGAYAGFASLKGVDTDRLDWMGDL